MKFLFLSAFLLASGVAAYDTRIINGEEAPVGRFPYYTTLYANGEVDRDNFICGGSLIAPDFVITAAHCDVSEFEVVVGNSDLDGEDTGTAVRVVKKFQHEDWDRLKITDDIMLLQLETPVIDQSPITMNFEGDFPIEDPPAMLTAIGLGRTTSGFNGPIPEKLQYTDTRLFPFQDCEDLYVPQIGGWLGDLFIGFFRDMDGDKQICAGGETYAVCSGDSGGPLVASGTSEDGAGDILLGITSYGVATCAQEGFPDVFTRISGYEDWIKTRVCSETQADPKPEYCVGYVPGTGDDSGDEDDEDDGSDSGGSLFCFSGVDSVEVENVGNVEMKDIKIGDSILVGPNKYEPVYSFGHRSDSLKTEFLSIATSNGATLEITKDHLVFIDGGVSIPASDLKKDMQMMHNDGLTSIKSIKTIVREGLYAPFTPSGKLVVNGFEVSSFVSIDGSATIKLFGMMDLHYHTMSRLFESPRRITCQILGNCSGETYNDEGMSSWHAVFLQAYMWLLNQNTVTFHVGFLMALVVVGSLSVMELFASSGFLVAFILGAYVKMSRNTNVTIGKKAN